MSYNSHYAILAAALARTVGPVLELGCGEGSTPLIHYVCDGRRPILSVDTDEKWISQYASYVNNTHGFEIVRPAGDDALPKVTREIQGWREWNGIERHAHWGVAFLDCAPGEARHELAIRLANHADFVVCHDSETDYAAGGNYMYSKAKEHFRYWSEFRRWRPYTLILSNFEKFAIEDCDLVWSPPA